MNSLTVGWRMADEAFEPCDSDGGVDLIVWAPKLEFILVSISFQFINLNRLRLIILTIPLWFLLTFAP